MWILELDPGQILDDLIPMSRKDGDVLIGDTGCYKKLF
jgi:hypothetical protein